MIPHHQMTQRNGQENEFIKYQSARQAHWDATARRLDHWRGWGGYYHQRLVNVYRYLIVPDQTILEIGCGHGDLLAALEPSFGVGIDLSFEMVRRAKKSHPNLKFIQSDAQQLCLNHQFDFIILSDLLNDLWDVQDAFEQISHLCGPHTRVIVNSYNRMWEIPLAVTERIGLAKPNLYQNWLTVEDIENLLYLSNFEVIRHWEEILWPLYTPIVDAFCNRFLVRFWPFKYFALTNMVVARPAPQHDTKQVKSLVSVVVPARNEAGNIANIFKRVPQMGRGTELIFIEGHSTDNTYEVIEEMIESNPDKACKLFRQEGEGKGDAVRLGFKHASGEILMILDADLTVPPEDLPLFYEVITSRKGDFANGVRLIYPLEDESMRFINLIGNKFFSIAFTWLLGQTIKDTLCGTKVLRKHDYERIAANRAYFGDFDPFGDFDLLLGAAKQNLKITDVPIRYKKRMYGTTNIQRWKHGWLLIRMLIFAARRLKFI